MNSTAKVLIPDREWLIHGNQEKLGSISKSKKGYAVFYKGNKINFKNMLDIKLQLGISSIEEGVNNLTDTNTENIDYTIYDFPCYTMPYEPTYSVKKKLPLYTKSINSKSQYCAGYYTVKFKKGWVKSFCPKLITLTRYPYYGPFKTEAEMKIKMSELNRT